MSAVVLAFDTATASTVVGLGAPGLDAPIELRDDPSGRPRHTTMLLGLAREALERAGLGFADVTRVVAGTGPGSFTGLRIGLATARGLALASGAETAGVSTLRVLARAAEEAGAGGVVAPVIDARRGEVFVAAWGDGCPLLEPRATAPESVPALAAGAPWLAVGDGALRYRDVLEAGGIAVAGEDSPLHRVDAAVLVRLGAEARPVARTELLPDYLRAPDAELARRPAATA